VACFRAGPCRPGGGSGHGRDVSDNAVGGGYSLVRVTLGVILLVAGGLKAHQLATDPFVTLFRSSPLPPGEAKPASPLPPGEGRVRALPPGEAKPASPLPSGEGRVRAFLSLAEGCERALAPFLHSRLFLIGIVEFELLLGLLLLSGILPRFTWASSLICFGGFALVSLYRALSGDASCGCFGRVPVSPWYTAILDLAGVLALLAWRPTMRRSLLLINVRPVPVRGIGVVVLWLLAGVPAAFALSSSRSASMSDVGDIVGDGAVVVLEPKKWIGKRCPLLEYIDDAPGTSKPGEQPVRERLAKGEWIVVLYHHDCPRCIEDVPKYEDLARRSAANGTAPRVALIEVSPFADRTTGLVSRDTHCALGRLDGTRTWFVDALASFTLCAGQCTSDGKDVLLGPHSLRVERRRGP